MGGVFSSKTNCVFCEITSDIDNPDASDTGKILHHNDKLAILADLHPAAKHHYLVIPRFHVKNPKALKGQEHIELVKEMQSFGKEYLHSVEKEENVKDCLLGFHFPPFISVDHLHLHVISPSTSMNFTNTNLFRKDTWYFISPEKLIEKLQMDV